ncbi:MAG TPA: D-threitol dehydrogenase, partial [Gemmatimonadales bacterium]
MRRTALVTGGARGIGRAIVTALADQAWVASLDCDFPEGPGAAAATFSGDVRDGAAVGAAVER